MTRKLRILIVDPNQFFVTGLQHAIKNHCLAKGISVVFTYQQLSRPVANLIFWAPSEPMNLMPLGLLTNSNRSSRLIMIMPQQKAHLVQHHAPWVFYRHQCLNTLLALIDRTLMTTTISSKKEVEKRSDRSPLDLLTRRQKEIIRYVSEGMSPNKIANNLNIHEKTVSSHKRSAMKRLQLSRTADLYHLLLCHSIPWISEQRREK
ncbi:helix-turn-helix transcriptional regulator [Yersinia aleksiciae]|uniref:helix-turn-helix transcriptional regulator n=1 Tax=Yersinia aleksiciae TaxID=263819 RepID=UPI0011A122AD|nr:LuxR family transcriptional regulator [Yersinia aleksiciae]